MDENPYKSPIDTSPTTIRRSRGNRATKRKTPLWIQFSGLAVLALATWLIGGYPTPIVTLLLAVMALIAWTLPAIRTKQKKSLPKNQAAGDRRADG
jgi:hypothetical protein